MRPNIDWGAVLTVWNEEIAPTWSLPVLRKLTEDRKAKIRRRLLEFPNLWEELRAEIPKMKEELALSGWLNLDWIIKSENNLTKLLEGNYRDNGNGKPKHEQATYTPKYHRISKEEKDNWDLKYSWNAKQRMPTEEGCPLPKATDDDMPF
jgi:hypothetical protein